MLDVTTLKEGLLCTVTVKNSEHRVKPPSLYNGKLTALSLSFHSHQGGHYH